MREILAALTLVGCGADPANPAPPPAACEADQVCAAAVPEWQGPVVFSESCPSAFPDALTTVHAGLQAPDAVCPCTCTAEEPDCDLQAWDNARTTSAPFAPDSCDSPSFSDACLDAVATGRCTAALGRPEIEPVAWSETASACGGATPEAECADGACYPAGDALCVYRDGVHECPADYPEASTWHRDFEDSRDCANDCACTADDATCELTLEICSLGIFEIALASDDDLDTFCLNSSDGDGVTILARSAVSNGTCAPSGGSPVGSAVEAEPVTVCCQP